VEEKKKFNNLLIKILMKHALKYIDNNDNIDKNIRNQIESALKSVNRKEVDLSKIDILSFDSEIIKSIKTLFKNLLTIKKKASLTRGFQHFVYKLTGAEDIQTFRQYYNELKRYKRLQVFKEESAKSVCLGDSLLQINYSSQGKVEHYYKINIPEQALFIYDTKESKKPSKYYFEKDITTVFYGIRSKNLDQRFKDFKSAELKQPWLYLSFVTEDKSVDLLMKEAQIVTWYFGLNQIFAKNDWKVNMETNSTFVVKKPSLN